MSSATPQNTLQAQEIRGTRGDRTLFDGLDFTLTSGQLLHLRGHNGSGKTTLMRILAGLLMPEEGEVLWNGQNIRRQRQAFNAQLLYLGHLNGLKGDLNAIENLRTGAALGGLPVSEDAAWQTLADIGLRGFEDLPTRVLSQGQKRRVALARLWFNRAGLWILDEPFSALDVAAVDALQEVIRQQLERGGMVVLTTHQEVELTRGEPLTLTLGASHA